MAGRAASTSLCVVLLAFFCRSDRSCAASVEVSIFSAVLLLSNFLFLDVGGVLAVRAGYFAETKQPAEMMADGVGVEVAVVLVDGELCVVMMAASGEIEWVVLVKVVCGDVGGGDW